MAHALCRHLEIEPGEVSSNGEFTVEHAPCLGLCDHAPAVLVGEAGPEHHAAHGPTLERQPGGPDHADPGLVPRVRPGVDRDQPDPALGVGGVVAQQPRVRVGLLGHALVLRPPAPRRDVVDHDRRAEGFGAEGAYLSAAKKLLDPRDPSVRAVTAVRSRTLGFSVKQIEVLLGLWDDRERASAEVKRMAQAHADDLGHRIEEMQAMQRTLLELAHRCHGDDRPDCPILDDLAGPSGS